jgi:hypothetical protein
MPPTAALVTEPGELLKSTLPDGRRLRHLRAHVDNLYVHLFVAVKTLLEGNEDGPDADAARWNGEANFFSAGRCRKKKQK